MPSIAEVSVFSAMKDGKQGTVAHIAVPPRTVQGHRKFAGICARQ
jgi:hypothetical protein